MQKINRYKRFIAILLLVTSIITCIPKQASAFVEGWTGSGGTGVNWLCGAREWPCFTITILDETFDNEIQAMNMAGNPSEEMEKARTQVRNQFRRKLPDPPNRWDSPTQARLFVMPKYLGRGNSLANSVKYINMYKYSLGYDVSLSEEESYKYMYKLNSPVYNVPSKFLEIRTKTYEFIKNNNYDSSKLTGIWGASTTGKFSYGEAEEVLRYIFSSDTGIETRLAELTYSKYYDDRPAESLTEDGQAWQKAAMVTLGMALYYVSGEYSSEQAYFGKRIDDFLDNNETNKKQPFIIEVEPASVWVDMTGKHFVMNCGDLLDRMSSAVWDNTNWGVRAHGWNIGDFSIFSLIEASWTAMLNKHAGMPRQEYQDFYYPQGSKTRDHFVYGWSLATGIWYGLEGNQISSAKGDASGYITNFGFYKNMYGFLLAFNSSLFAKVKAVKGSQDIEKEGDDLTTIRSNQDTIGQNVKITLRSNSTPDEIKTWKDRYESTKPNFLVAAEIKKTEGPQTQVTALGELLNDKEAKNIFSYDKLIQFLEGTLTFDYEDNVSSVLIANDEVINNKYKSRVWIIEEKELATNKWVELKPNDGKTSKDFKREPIRPSYISSPSYYSEIKNNEPEDEEWEAMAGVPTTERLYFASGGSEFIVDVELEYVPNQTTTRTYTDIFTSVLCENEEHVPNDKGGHTGACHHHKIPSSSVSWSQSITYDYMKMLRCQVWKIEKSKVDGMSKITRADDEITATIQTGDPTAFWNVAKSNDAKGGRIVYSLYPEQLDNVVWTQPSSNSCSSYEAENAAVTEQHKALTNQATVVSDFLVLQTNAGDQSVFYFDKKSNVVRTDTNFDFEKSSEDEMWKNNSKASADWEENHITISSYNGKYKDINNKYKSKGKGTRVETAFDVGSYGNVMQRPDRPGNQMLLYKQFEQDKYNTNGLYKTGHAYTFYKHIVDEGKESYIYSDSEEAKQRFGDKGLMYESTYSPTHSKVNDIVIHDPVSSEKAMVIPLPDERDQRTENSKPALREPTQDSIEYISKLPDDYMNNIVFNGYARYLNSKGQALGWEMSENLNTSITTSNIIKDDESAWSRENDKYWDGTQRSFLLSNDSDKVTYLTQMFGIGGGNTFKLKGSIKGSGGYIGLSFLDSNGNNIHDVNISESGELTVTAPSNATKVRVYMRKDGKGEARFDNIQVYCESNKGRFTPNNLTVLDWKVIKNPAYHSHNESGCEQVTEYKCNNLPLNAGGSIQYEWYNDYHRKTVWYDSNKGHEVDYCENHPSHPTGNTRLGGTPTTHVHTSACEKEIKWNCGLQDTSVGDKILNKCDNELNAGLVVYWDITHGDNCSNAGKTHRSTSRDKCSVCGHTCGGDIKEVRVYTKHEHTDKCYTTINPEQKELLGWYNADQQPFKNAQSWEYIQIVKEPSPHKEIQTPQGTFKPGNFINLDYPFQIYFPNEGDFEGTNELGIRKTTKDRGYGFEDNMDTTKWTQSKYVIFEFDVIFKGKMYGAGERIYLDVDEDTFDFYCPLENKEYLQSGVTFVAIAINNKHKQVDNEETTNKLRYGSKLEAKHSSSKVYFIDVVGRIGNMSIQDTGDFRFANFFKKSFNNGEWLIENIVPTVDIGNQNNIVSDQIDIRGVESSDKTKYTNTYGLEGYKEQQGFPFPLNPVYNNIEALRRQPLRIGYPTFLDVDTIGDYAMGKVQILPYYYALNLTTGKIDPVDIYMSVNGSYKLINKYNKLQEDGTIKEDEIYNNKVYLNWFEESIRRNYTGEQSNNSQDAVDYYNKHYTYADVTGFEGNMEERAETPYGSYYVMGNNNALLLTPRARSFVGTQYTYEDNKNPGRRVNPLEYTLQGQRWHYTLSLPSTAVAVKAGEKPTTNNINEIKNRNHVILTAVDVKALGTQYTLQGDTKNNQITIQTVKPDGTITSKDYPVGSIPHKIVTVNSANKTSRDDLAVSGTH